MESLDKTTRSIFVGNIPYEATEEKLMALFSQAGPVIGFRLVYDRESGKPKGYGFCEYNSSAVAASALRNLDNIDYNGRPLRIGPAAGEQNSAEVAMTNNSTMKPPQESPYGEKTEPDQSGLAISKAVASLPPEQLFDLMQQMKQCIASNPIEARQLLLQNPQLAYALLQAQIIMKIVEPKVAIAMLTRSNEQIPQTVMEQQQLPQMQQPQPQPMFINQQQPQQYPPNVAVDHMQPGMFPRQPPMGQGQPPMHMGHLQAMQQQQMGPQQLQQQQQMGPQQQPFNPLFGPGGPPGNSGNFCPPPMFAHQPAVAVAAPVDMKADMGVVNARQQQQQQEAVAAEMMNYLGRTGEKEKAALIMQVLSLSDEEVAKLPDDQRRSIEVLKSQLKKN